jgi:hypothetical protein
LPGLKALGAAASSRLRQGYGGPPKLYAKAARPGSLRSRRLAWFFISLLGPNRGMGVARLTEITLEVPTMQPHIAHVLLAITPVIPASPKLDPALSAQLKARVAVVQQWASDPIVVQAVREANRNPRTMEEIETINRAWEAATGVTEFMRTLIDHPAARRLKELRSSSPEIQEAFLTDELGANVAITNKTSDFYQGDEVQFLEAFNQGKGGVHIGELSLDESIHSYSIHVGVPIVDQERAIGVLLAAVNVEKLKQKTPAR